MATIYLIDQLNSSISFQIETLVIQDVSTDGKDTDASYYSRGERRKSESPHNALYRPLLTAQANLHFMTTQFNRQT